MGFIKAFSGALSSTFADQWKDFYEPLRGVPATAGVFRAVPNGTNANRGENYKGSENIITNGSKIIVPEGLALITMQDGAITGFIAEAGGFVFHSDDPNSKSMFSGDGIISSTITQSFERFKFGGVPGTEQLAFYVNLKEIPNNKFGTMETVYWNDSYLDLKAGGMARGTYSLKITDPILFIKNFVPAKYLMADAEVFDFADMDNDAGNQLFQEFVGCLSSGLSKFSQEAKVNNMDTMDYVQGNSTQFALTMSSETENTYHWLTERGLSIKNVSLVINYDEKTKEVLEKIREDDINIRRAKRMGEAYSNNMPGMMASATGQAMENASSNENGAMMGFMGMNMASQAGNSVLGTVNNMASSTPQAPKEENPYEKLTELKKLLDNGVITQEDFNAAKAKILGI